MIELDEYPLRDTAIYNPHLLSKEELIGHFVARRKLLDQLLEDLSRCRPGETPQHHLLVAQRGMGKTMLLRRLYFAVEDDSKLAASWLPLAFPEEQYNVGRLSDLWLNCLDALSDALERLGRTDEARSLDSELEALLDLEEERRSRETLALLLTAAAGIERRLVLLIDNIDLIFERISEQSWALREILSENPAILLVGASSRALESSYKYDQPFYDFFHIHELGGLNLEETTALLMHYAKRWRNEDVLRIVRDEPARIRTLHTLTGGNPRTVALLYNILMRGLDGDVRTDLESLLDHCTPLYKARLEALAPQRQRVVHALALHWHPATAADIAAELRLDVNAVSTQLGRLVREGVVEAVPYDPPTKTGFQIAERFFNIWYLMRATRRARRRLTWLVEFLKMFYSQDQLRARLRSRAEHKRRLEELREATLDADPKCRACSAEQLWDVIAHSVQPLDRKERIATGLANASPEELDDTLRDLEREAAFTAELVGSERLADALREAYAKGWIMETHDVEGARLAAIRLVEPGLEAFALARKLDIVKDPRSLLEEIEPHLASTDSPAVFALWAKHAASLDPKRERLGEVLESLRSYRIRSPLVLTDLAVAWLRTGHAKKAMECLGRAREFEVEQVPKSWLKHVARAWVIAGHELGDGGWQSEAEEALEKAIEMLQRAVDLSPKDEYSWVTLGVTLRCRGRHREAEESFHKAIELSPHNARGWQNIATSLFDQKRFQDAEEACRKVVELTPGDAFAWRNLGLTLDRQGRHREAEEAYRKAVELSPQSVSVWRNLAGNLFKQNRFEEAEGVCHKMVGLTPEQVGNFLSGSSEKFRGHIWPEILMFFRDAVATGKAREAAKLLDRLGMAEQWQPLRQALETAAIGSRSYLKRLAPEVRQPVVEILEQFENAAEDYVHCAFETTSEARLSFRSPFSQ